MSTKVPLLKKRYQDNIIAPCTIPMSKEGANLMAREILKVKLLHENEFIPFSCVIDIDDSVDHVGLLNEEESVHLRATIKLSKKLRIKSYILKRFL